MRRVSDSNCHQCGCVSHTLPMQVSTPHSLCRFGLARGDITPPVGIYHRMWGAATHDRSTGVHRPLTATAVVLRPLDPREDNDNASEQIILAVDHCLLWPREMDELLARVSAGSDTPRERIVVAFSHTHGAGLMGLERSSLPGGELIAPYLESLADTLAALLRDARASARPATIQYAHGRCDLAAHRDCWDAASGQYVCGYNPGGPADDTVLVARVTGDDGRLLATLVNYACHPTTLAWENTLISPDYPGAMRETIEGATGAPCVFLQGASGDLGPREGYVGDTAVADRNGRQLGYAALAALESLPPPRTRFEYAGPVVSGATLGAWAHRPLDEAELRLAAEWQVRRWTVPLRWRAGVNDRQAALREREECRRRELGAADGGDSAQLRDARAMTERAERRLVRIDTLPPGEEFAYPVTLLRMGDAWWLAVEGEPYNVLQRELRRRLAPAPLVVMALANGSRPAYLPPADLYGRGIYQEQIALLAPGTLEALIEEIARSLNLLRES